MAGLIQSVAILALVLMGLAVIVGMIEPHEVVQRILIFFGFLIFAPSIAAILVRSLIVPALDAVRAVLRPVLIVAVSLAIVAIVLWVVLQFHRSGEKP